MISDKGEKGGYPVFWFCMTKGGGVGQFLIFADKGEGEYTDYIFLADIIVNSPNDDHDK